MQTTTTMSARRRWVVPRPDREAAWVLAMSAALAALAVAGGWPFLGAPALNEAVHLPWWLLAAGFAATEACVLHIQVKREAQTVSISELPLVLGLFFASPTQLLIGRLVGSAAILLFYRRASGVENRVKPASGRQPAP